MKSLLTAVVLSIGASLAGLVFAADDHHEADMKDCAVCKSMAKPEMMEHLTWETHKINNGMLCVATVDKDHMKEFESAHKEMTDAIAKVESDSASGKDVSLCSFCEGMGSLKQAGAKMQEIKTQRGAVSLVTSDDPSVVAQIHAQADKAIAMQKEMASKHDNHDG